MSTLKVSQAAREEIPSNVQVTREDRDYLATPGMMADAIRPLLAPEACLDGTPMVPLNQATLTTIYLHLREFDRLTRATVSAGREDHRKLLGDLRAVRAHHAYTRDHVGQPGCEVRKVAAEYTETLDLALAALQSPIPVAGAIPAGMKPWAGGDRAPADWDGGRVFGSDGKTYGPGNLTWKHGLKPSEVYADIIAYTPLPATPIKDTEHAG